MTDDNKVKLLDAYRMAAEGGHKEIADALASVIIGEMSGMKMGVPGISVRELLQTPGTTVAVPDVTWGDRRVMCETGGAE